MNVVLPEPDGPRTTTTSWRFTVQGDALEDVELAEPLVDVCGVDDECR